MSQLTTTTQEQQHKSIYDIFSYVIYGEQIHIIKDLSYYQKDNSYRIIIKSGHNINFQVMEKINKSNWEIETITSEETVNYHAKPLPNVFTNIIMSIKPKGSVE